jgi:hypothetical protein
MRRIPQYKESLKIVRSALEAETQDVVQVSTRLNENLVEADRKIWRQTLFIWAVVILAAILYFIFLRNSIITTNQSKNEQIVPQILTPPQDITSPSQSPIAGSETSPLSPAIPEKEDLIRLLNQIREAQSKKNIRLFMDAYAPTFPNLAQKRNRTVNIWKMYDYIDSQFQIDTIKQENDSLIVGNITWDIKARDRKTRLIKTYSKSYDIHFVKQSGKWFIQELKPVKGNKN